MAAPRQPTGEGIAEEDDVIILSVRLRSNRFEGSIQMPLFASDEERAVFVDSWFKMMEAGLRCGRSRREAGT